MTIAKASHGKSNNNGTFWREQINSHIILITVVQS